MHTQRIGGYTLIELLIAFTVALMLTLFGIGGGRILASKTHNIVGLQAITTSLDRARSLAVIRGRHVGVCMLAPDQTCSGEWSGNVLAVFIDANKNRQHDLNEEIIYREPWPDQYVQLQWSNWREEPLISYKPDGAVTSNGTVSLKNSKGKKIASIVINKPGRARIDTTNEE